MAVTIWAGRDCELLSKHLQEENLKNSLMNCTQLVFVGISEDDTPSIRLHCKEYIPENVKIVTITSNSIIDATFKLKSHLDAAKILDIETFVPEENLIECGIMMSLLFPQIYNVRINKFPFEGVLKCWELTEVSDSSFETLIKQYLATVPSKDEVKTVQSRIIPLDMFTHGYTTRYGGVSTWPSMASLNMIYSLRKPDSLFVVKENARRLCAHVGRDAERYNLAKANHGKDIWVYEKKAPDSYDGIITCTPGVTVASPAADCNMLLLADPVTRSCGAIHAGWKGILVGVVEASVQSMVKEYKSDPNDLIASLGPSLSVCCCEFGAEESKKFLNIDEKVVVWQNGKEKPHLDLRLAVRILLMKSGLKSENIDDGVAGSNPTTDLAVCTKCDPNKNFFSFRRDGPKFGNCVAFIGLN